MAQLGIIAQYIVLNFSFSILEFQKTSIIFINIASFGNILQIL